MGGSPPSTGYGPAGHPGGASSSSTRAATTAPGFCISAGAGDPRGFGEVALRAGWTAPDISGLRWTGTGLSSDTLAVLVPILSGSRGVDLDTGTWSGPFLLARQQRSREPWTTWLYPLIVPDGDGFHLVVSNNGYRSSYYNRINYLYIPYGDPASAVAEVVAEVTPCKQNMAFAQAMWRTDDGALFVTATRRHQGGQEPAACLPRDPGARRVGGGNGRGGGNRRGLRRPQGVGPAVDDEYFGAGDTSLPRRRSWAEVVPGRTAQFREIRTVETLLPVRRHTGQREPDTRPTVRGIQQRDPSRH